MLFLEVLNILPGVTSARARRSTGGNLVSNDFNLSLFIMRSLQHLKDLGRTAREEVRALFPSFPKANALPLDFVCFGITDDCILKCKMCHKWKEDIFVKNKTTTPTLTDWKRCVASLRSIAGSSLQINFGGGEPLLHKDIFELVGFCKQKGFKTNIATNGYLIDEEMAKKIADSGLDSIIISLDSLKEEVHDHLRGLSGVYRKVMNSIELLDKFCAGLFKGICCVIYQENMNDVLEVAEWIQRDNRINSVYFMAAMQPNNTIPESRWQEKEEYAMLWPKESSRVCALIDALIKMKEANPKITNQVCQLEAFKLYYQQPERFVKSSKCNLGSALHVSSTGDIFLCYRWDVLGNISCDDISSLWNSNKASQVRKDIATCKNNCHFLLNCFFKEEYPFKITPQQACH